MASLPDIALPSVQVTVTLPGATPSQLETDVTRRIEDAVASLAEIDKIVSAVSEGSSVTRIEFELGRDINEPRRGARRGQPRVADLPNDIEEPVIARAEPIGGRC